MSSVPDLAPTAASGTRPEAQAVHADDIRRGVTFMLLQIVLFAVLNALVKGLAARLPVIEVAFFRQVVALVPVAVLVARQGGLPMLATKRPLGHLFRGVIGNLSMIVLFLSYAWLPLAEATALSFATPLFITALSVPLLSEPVGPYRWSAVAVGFLGVLVITDPGSAWLEPGQAKGATVGVFAAFLSALMMITVRQLGRTEPAARIVFWFTLIGIVIFGAALPFLWVAPSPTEWAGLTAVGLLGGIAQLALTTAYRHAPAAVLAPLSYLMIVWTTLLGWWFWRDLPGIRAIAGSAIIIASGLYIGYRETVRRRRLVAAVPSDI